MKPVLEEMKKLKTELFELELSKFNKSKSWTIVDLDRARVWKRIINELFKAGVAGKDFKLSLLKFFNRMKEETFIPDFVRMADVANIYKGRGEKNELQNDCWIFKVTIFAAF